MTGVAEVLTPSDLATVRGLQLLARQVVEGGYQGLHRSPLKGFSVDFKEHRPYLPGDDIRTIDWKLYGKTDRFFIREYEEETSLTCTLIVDSSGSMAYRGSRADHSKHDYAVRLAACLAYLLLRQQDSVGLVTLDTDVRRYIPPRSRPRHLRVMLEELLVAPPGGETDLGGVLHKVAPRLRSRGLVVIVSDLFGDAATLLKALARLGRSQVMLLQTLDPDELDFPFEKRTRFESLEVADEQHLVDPVQLRELYLQRLAAYQDELSAGCRRQGITLETIGTDRPYAEVLARLLSRQAAGAA